MRSFTVPLALVADLVCVLAFVLIGKADHETGTALASVASTAWPFAAGALLGWVVTLAWRSPVRIWPTGVFVWAVTVAGAMVLRLFSGGSAPFSFVLVTSLFLATTMLGWRAVVLLVATTRQRGA